MPRPLVFGNGRLLVQLDQRARIRDLYWPLVSGQNHVAGQTFRLGLFYDGRLTWTDSTEWRVHQSYEAGLEVGVSSFDSPLCPLQLKIRDCVTPEDDVFLREIEIENISASDVDAELFFHQDLCIDGTRIGDTALHHPAGDIVHYQGRRAFAFSAASDDVGVGQVAIGVKGFKGLQGTWRDAEDGRLQYKAIEQGSVDSTFGLAVAIRAGQKRYARYWIACATTIAGAVGLSSSVRHGRSQAARRRVDDTHLTAPRRVLGRLPDRLRSLAERSLLVIRSQTAENGAILAASDSEVLEHGQAHYGYVWPRDGALVAEVLDRVGLHEEAERYHRFALGLIGAGRPYFLQKYNADGSLGSTWMPWSHEGLPIQEDETALTVWSLGQHLLRAPNPKWLRREYARTLKPMAEFLVDYRDGRTGLPLPSYDLWEERCGVHALTTAAIAAGLTAAARLGEHAGDPSATRFQIAAEETETALISRLLDIGARSLVAGDGGSTKPDTTVDASVLLIPTLIHVKPALLRAYVDKVEDSLLCRTGIGGIARYEGDWYWRRHEGFPGNPWAITTLWLARAHFLLGNLENGLRHLEWVADRAENTGIIAEQFDPISGSPISVSPLTWSHAEFVATCLDALEAGAWAK